MRRLTLVATAVALVTLALAPAVAGKPESQRNFTAHLQGSNEILPVDSRGQGQVMFKLDKAGETMRYKLIVANIEGVTQAHIHCGSAEVNGPVVVFLFGPDAGEGEVNGVLAQGTITATEVIARPDSEMCPGGIADFDELIAKMRSGDAYVNVHTVTNPPGEIRGQLK